MHRMHGQLCGAWLALLGGASSAVVFAGSPNPAPSPACSQPSPEPLAADTAPVVTAPKATTAPSPAVNPANDPVEVFSRVVDRYQHLLTYRDCVRLVQTTQRDGQTTSSVETQLTCEIAEDKLNVQTAASQWRSALGLALPAKATPAMEKVQLNYDLWLAPHMAMRFQSEPLKDFRAGVAEGFTATEAESVTIDNRNLVHVALRSGDGLSENCAARFDLFINAESMLIERIEGEQRMPDGANYQTTLHITPIDYAPASALGDDALQPTT